MRTLDWTDGLHGRLRGQKPVTRLALAIAPVRSIVRVVDPRVPAVEVEWASVGQAQDGGWESQSATLFRQNTLVINPLPILEDKLEPREQVDVCIGQAVHEASHSKHLRGLWYETLLRREDVTDRMAVEAMRRDESTLFNKATGAPTREVPAFEPLRVAAWLLNVASDLHDEQATLADWPGFAEYIDAMLDWLWTEANRAQGTMTPLRERMRVAFMGARFHDRASAYAKPQDAAEMAWWRQWAEDYAAGRTSPSEVVRAGLERLGEDEQSAQEMREMAAEEAEKREQGERLRQQVERLIREGVEGVEGCVSRWAEASTLSESEAEAVRHLVREGLVEVEPLILAKGARKPAMRVRKPVEDAESRRAFVGRPDASVEAVRSALVFRQERPRHDLKLQRSGEMDDEELWRWATGDDRLFTDRVVESAPDTALGMLVDISGSMDDGRKIPTAQRLAQTLLAAAVDREGVTPWVWAHTGDADESGSDVYTVWEPGDPATRLGLIDSLPHGNNYDGFAIWLCADRLRQMEQPQKVLLVLSDGYPAGRDYGDRPAQQHVRQVCRWAESQGVTVIQIAIDHSLRPEDQAAMFGDGNWFQYRDDKQLVRDLTRILSRYA